MLEDLCAETAARTGKFCGVAPTVEQRAVNTTDARSNRASAANMVVYEDQDGTHRLSEEEAVAIAKRVAAACGYTHKNDEDALGDFLVIHWAWQESPGPVV